MKGARLGGGVEVPQLTFSNWHSEYRQAMVEYGLFETPAGSILVTGIDIEATMPVRTATRMVEERTVISTSDASGTPSGGGKSKGKGKTKGKGVASEEASIASEEPAEAVVVTEREVRVYPDSAEGLRLYQHDVDRYEKVMASKSQ